MGAFDPVLDLLIFAICQFSHLNNYSESFEITRYTSMYHKHDNCDNPVIYYATELMNGERRYDYAMIDFITDTGDTKCCPAKILGFIRYNKTSGIPTPQFIQDECLTIDEIK